MLNSDSYDPRQTPLYDYLDGWREWDHDPYTGEWSGRVFGPVGHTLAAQFKKDPQFPQAWLCSALQSPVVDIVGDVIDLLAPELVAGELDILRGALGLACAKNEDSGLKVLLAVLGLAGGAIGLAEAARRRQATSQRAPELVAPGRPPV
ncbi:MAG: hypothetical protein ACRDNK_18240 [Solirubrobacteraceae bacterium]